MRFLALVVFAVILLATSAVAANIVVNPGFETGSFAPWVANGDSDHPWCVDCTGDTFGAFTGSHWVSEGCVGASCITPDPNVDGAWLYQDLATTASGVYNLSFAFASDLNPMELQILWGPAGGSLSVVGDLVNIGAVPYTVYTINGLTATTGTTRIEFLGRQDPSFDALDDVCVDLASNGACSNPTEGGGVPEPASLVLGGGGLLGLGFLRFRRQRA